MRLPELQQAYAEGRIDKPRFIEEALALHRHLFDCVELTRHGEVREIVISPDGLCCVVGEHAIRLFCPADEARVAPIEALNFGRYEAFETHVMDVLTEDALQILDVGASLGWHALRWAKRLPQARVHAFEPLPLAFACLQRNIQVNDLGERVHAHALGLAAHSGAAAFFIRPTQGTNASLRNVAGAPDAQVVAGQVQTLDAWAQQHGVAPDFIKCDVEGAEWLVLSGAQRTLEQHRPIIFAELLRKWCAAFGHHPNQVLQMLAELGYTCFAVGPTGLRPLTAVDESTPETHYAFVHPTRHAAALARLQAMRNP